MSLTKIGSIGINTGIQFAGVTTVSTLHVGSGVTLSSDGDIFATGISTFSEDIKVGSGVTISPDGDVFFTGIITGNGSGLTNLATDLVNDTSPQLGGNLDVNTKNILFGDSSDGSSDDALIFGAGSDLIIYHDGSNSFIKNSTGNLRIQDTNGNIQIQAKAGEDSIIAKTDGAVEIYHDNSKRLETASYGVLSSNQVRVSSSNATTVAFSVGDQGTGFYNTGSNAIGYASQGTQKWNINSSGNLRLNDSVSAQFGTDSDLLIYHNGGTNYADIASGQQLYFRVNGSNKFYVQSGGAQFVGSLYADDSNKIELGSSQDFQIYHDGTSNIFQSSGLKNFIFRPKDTDVGLKIIGDGGVELYHDNTKMLETISTGTNIPDGKFAKFGNSNDMSMGHNTYNYITYTGADFLLTGDATNQIKLQPKSDEAAIICKPNAEVELYHDGTMQCETSSVGLKFPSGKGIDFSATGGPNQGSGSSELFDDYEEGSWTPTMSFGGSSSGITYQYQVGRYVKIGNIVVIKFGIRLSNNGSGTGNARVEGLPYNGVHSSYYHDSGALIMVDGGTDSSGGHANAFVTDTNKMAIRQGAFCNQNYDSTHTAFNNNTSIFGTVTYNTGA